MKKVIFLLFCFIAIVHGAMAGTIKGIVLDNTGETAIGAVVTIEGTNFGAVVGLDGSFTITNVPKGSYKLKVNLISYEPLLKDVVINDNNETATLNLAMQSQAKTLKEATVVAHVTGVSDANARLLEKNSDNVMNILSGRALQLMPDVTVANVLRRVSGVTVDRGDDGEGRYPVIRGMDKRYNYTLINGIKIPSPDDKNRYVPMDLFPSEMLQRLEVIKTLTPDMEGDAIGGVMNLVLKDAPDHLVVQAQGGLGYSQMLFDQTFRSYDHNVPMQSPEERFGSNYVATFDDFSKKSFDYKTNSPLPDGQFGVTIGNRFLHDKLGVIVSGMYQSTDRNSKELFFVPNPQPQAGYQSETPELDDMEQRYYSIHQDRFGAHVKLDYKINDNNKISFYTVLMKLNTYESRYIVDSTSGNRFAADGVTPIPGTGGVNLDYRSKTTLQSIYNGTLQGEHKVTNHLSVNWSAVYSVAGQKTPDWTDFSLTHTLAIDTNTGKPNNPPLALNSLSYYWQHNLDQDLSGYLNAHYKFNVNNQKFDIGVGGMYRNKNRNNYFIEYDLQPSIQGTLYTTANDVQFKFPQPGEGVGLYTNNPNNYTITENIAAAYAEIRWQPTDKWNILVGVREESTYDHYNVTTENASIAEQNGTTNYADVLPSANIKYSLTDKSALHASYFESISRPTFFEITPGGVPGTYFNETGNPYLKHSQANNYDLRYELFPGSADQLLIGAFYKKITNPIEYVYNRPAPGEAVLTPENLGTATNVGAEIVYTKYIKKFGVSFNYTYTYSNIPSPKDFYYDSVQKGFATVKTIIQNRPLEGQASHVGNISLLYKDVKKGIDAQVSAIYTGRHIVYVSPYYDMDYWARGTVILDLSAEKKLSKHFAVYAKLNNLLNTPDIIEMRQANFTSLKNEWPVQSGTNSILVEKKYYGQTYLIGLRYNL